MNVDFNHFLFPGMGTQFCEKQVDNPGFPAATLQCSVTDFVGMERQLQRGSDAFQKSEFHLYR